MSVWGKTARKRLFHFPHSSLLLAENAILKEQSRLTRTEFLTRLSLMTTVLIVEDDPINYRVFAKILTKRGGLEVKGTEDVEEVIRLAQTKAVDIILMDVSLANSMYQGKSVDGLKITQILKANPETAALPVILVTAHAMEGDRESFLAKSGANGYISKPVVDHEAFVAQIKAQIQG